MRGISLLKVEAPLEMARIKTQEGFNCTWACTLGEPRSERAPRPTRTARERSAAASWHAALVASCCGGKQSARVGLSPPDARDARRGSSGALRGSSGADGDTPGPSAEAELAVLAELDALLAALPSARDSGAALMRSVRCGQVAASFDDAPQLRRASAFWAGPGRLADFARSEPAHAAMRFVAHTWQPPADWHALMGLNCHFTEVKAAVLCTAARDFAAHEQRQIDRCGGSSSVSFLILPFFSLAPVSFDSVLTPLCSFWRRGECAACAHAAATTGAPSPSRACRPPPRPLPQD